ncbi:MAG: crosslink repair DNA glycosylase YcaQ family protein [Ornithinimicrobium sp.]
MQPGLRLSTSQARRIALAAQGFADPPVTGEVSLRHVRRVVDRVAVVQIDSVNVVSRSHYLPFFSRLGFYRRALVDDLRDAPPGRATPRPGRLVEYWAHEASLIPATTWPFLAFRMRGARREAATASLMSNHPGLLPAVREVVQTNNGITSRQVEALLPAGSARRREQWGWNWSAVKECLEHLFVTGTITSAGRTAQFERRYAAPEAVLPPDVLDRGPHQDGSWTDAQCAEHLIRLSARAHGVGTEICLRDYFRLPPALARAAIASLVAAGELETVQISGWERPAYLDPRARRPRRDTGTGLLSPFDSLIWQRERTERLFGFRYRLEIYTPKERRVHGYYVLPYLLDGVLVARVDLKADRAQNTLRVFAVHYEPGAPRHAQESLIRSLHDMSRWLGLECVALP